MGTKPFGYIFQVGDLVWNKIFSREERVTHVSLFMDQIKIEGNIAWLDIRSFKPINKELVGLDKEINELFTMGYRQ